MAQRRKWIDEQTIQKEGLWTVEFSPFAVEALKATERRQSALIFGYIDRQIHAVPNPRGVGRRLKYPIDNLWRYQAGDYRMVAHHNKDRRVVTIILIERRGSDLLEHMDHDILE